MHHTFWRLRFDVIGADGQGMPKATDRTTAESDPSELIDRLRQVFEVVSRQIQKDPAFADQMRHALEPPVERTAVAVPPSPAPKTVPPKAVAPARERPSAPRSSPPASPPEPTPAPPAKRRRAVIDPFALYDSGWEAMLRSHLDRLDVEQLRDVIHQYRLDPKDQTERQTDPERLRDWIVNAVEDIGSNL